MKTGASEIMKKSYLSTRSIFQPCKWKTELSTLSIQSKKQQWDDMQNDLATIKVTERVEMGTQCVEISVAFQVGLHLTIKFIWRMKYKVVPWNTINGVTEVKVRAGAHRNQLYPNEKILYYRKLYFTTENFTLLQKTLLHKKYYSTTLEPIKIPFIIRKLTLFFFLILIDVEQRTIFRQVTIFRHLFLISCNFFIFHRNRYISFIQ